MESNDTTARPRDVDEDREELARAAATAGEVRAGARAGRAHADALILAALAAGTTQGAAAEAAGVSEDSVSRRMADPLFRAKLERIRRDILERVVHHVTAASTKAVATLEAVLQDPEARAAERVQAARTLLDTTTKMSERVDLTARITMLENQLREERAAKEAKARAERDGRRSA
jgi:hypothetical protein